MKPSQGRIVIVETPTMHNNIRQHPAVITRVWGAGEPQPAIEGHAPATGVCVNVMVLPDAGQPFAMTSTTLFDSEADAMAHGSSGCRAWWPPRV